MAAMVKIIEDRAKPISLKGKVLVKTFLSPFFPLLRDMVGKEDFLLKLTSNITPLSTNQQNKQN